MRLRVASILLTLVTVPIASATPQYLEVFLKTYGVVGKLKAAECSVCHTEIPKHNAYGTEIDTALRKEGTKTLDAALLRAIEGGDPDDDGATTGAEIRANTLPGDAKSHPPVATKPVRVVARSAERAASLVPKHAFHPTLVHFPLALFLFGVALDLVGMWRGRSEVRKAAVWNMTAAAIATAGAIPTGFVAASLSGYPLTWGTGVVTHLLYGLGGTALMTGIVVWRARAERGGFLYVITLLATMVVVGWAGHLGGDLVYGK